MKKLSKKETHQNLSFLGSYINGRFQESTQNSRDSSQTKILSPYKIKKQISSKKRIKPANLKLPPQNKKKENSSKSLKKHCSPADFKDLLFNWDHDPSLDYDSVCLAGQKAGQKWSEVPLSKRAQKLKQLNPIIKKNIKSWGEIIARETGKALWESEGEVKALLSKIDFTLNEGLKRIETQLIPQAQGQIRFKSRGLCLVIGPFNFPIHLPFGQILPALLAGNAVLFKPSEKTPASAQALSLAFDEIGLEPGLYQMIQSGSKVSSKLCKHPLVSAIFFTGSFPIGQKIKSALMNDPNKFLALEMGGYNSALIWKDANLDLAVQECLKACFWTTGQRCSSCSQILLHPSIAKSFIKKFVKSAQKIPIGHWSENPWMGSLIDEPALKRFFTFQKQIEKEKGQFLLEGQRLFKEKGWYVSPGIYKIKPNKKSKIGREENFTPQVVLYETSTLEEALEMIHRSGYGLSLSVFSQNKKVKKVIAHRAKVGLIYYNLASVGASSYLPFGGCGKSGNDRPAGAFAIDSCVIPVAEKGDLP